jgi:hypothetical protein
MVHLPRAHTRRRHQRREASGVANITDAIEAILESGTSEARLRGRSPPGYSSLPTPKRCNKLVNRLKMATNRLTVAMM